MVGQGVLKEALPGPGVSAVILEKRDINSMAGL
jgi:hypothetical protein